MSKPKLDDQQKQTDKQKQVIGSKCRKHVFFFSFTTMRKIDKRRTKVNKNTTIFEARSKCLSDFSLYRHT